ncbi:Rpn family recombination-promoting nuclease/putative transposase [Candidatus Electronema sp. PJ]|uniref:Rpn family recombination-promoting nuclease/putative transposase n=1 Tax=Candidatus Electronema sp. PJ TaxID=3401572 RepID=UPI003AA899EC
MSRKRLISFDWAMRNLLVSKENFEILEGFLSELLRDDIHIFEILESENEKKDRRKKFNRVDLLVKNKQGEVVIIEIQYERESDCLQRILCGTSKVITEHIQESKPYAEIVKVISVNILYYDLGQGEDYVYHGSTSFLGLHKQDVLQLSEDQQEIYQKHEFRQIFPEYYLIKVNGLNEPPRDGLDEWIYFLKNEEIREDFKAKGLAKAWQVLDFMALAEQERFAYERYQEDLRHRSTMLRSSYTLGVKKGVKQGIKQGVRHGLMQGERKKAREIALKLIDVLDAQTIAQKTGLSVEEITALPRSKA